MSTESQTTESGLKERQLYSDLTDKQRAVVDAIVENPNANQGEIADIADSSQKYVSIVQNEYDHIIDEREHIVNNSHATVEKGNVRVEGEIDLSDPDKHPKPQTFDERPVKATECDHTIDDFLPEATCARLERIAEDISPDWLDRRATVEETVQALAQDHALPEDTQPDL